MPVEWHRMDGTATARLEAYLAPQQLNDSGKQ